MGSTTGSISVLMRIGALRYLILVFRAALTFDGVAFGR